MESFEKRNRERQKRQKQLDKVARRKERSEIKKEIANAPPGSIVIPEEEIIDGPAENRRDIGVEAAVVKPKPQQAP